MTMNIIKQHPIPFKLLAIVGVIYVPLRFIIEFVPLNMTTLILTLVYEFITMAVIVPLLLLQLANHLEHYYKAHREMMHIAGEVVVTLALPLLWGYGFYSTLIESEHTVGSIISTVFLTLVTTAYLVAVCMYVLFGDDEENNV